MEKSVQTDDFEERPKSLLYEITGTFLKITFNIFTSKNSRGRIFCVGGGTKIKSFITLLIIISRSFNSLNKNIIL